MESIVITFSPQVTGRIEFGVEVMTADRLSFRTVEFKLDTGSDFTTLSCDDLLLLGYTDAFLQTCNIYGKASSAAGDLDLRYIDNISIKFRDREIQGCRIFFALRSHLRSLFGSDILRYFNYSVNNDIGELKMSMAAKIPKLTHGEPPLHIYSLNYESADE